MKHWEMKELTLLSKSLDQNLNILFWLLLMILII